MVSPKMTPQTVAVLRALLTDPTEPWYGRALCDQTGLKSGTVEPLLARLQRAGLVESAWEHRPPMKGPADLGAGTTGS